MRREVQNAFQLYYDTHERLMRNPGTLQDRELAINTSEFTNNMLDVYGNNALAPSPNPRNDWRRYLLCMRYSVAADTQSQSGWTGYQVTRIIPTLEFLRYNGGLSNGNEGVNLSGAKQIGFNPFCLGYYSIVNDMKTLQNLDNVQDAIDALARKLSTLKNINPILNIADVDYELGNRGTLGTIASIMWINKKVVFTNDIKINPMRSALFGDGNTIFAGANIVAMGEKNKIDTIRNSVALGLENSMTECRQSVLFGANNTMNSITNSIVGGKDNAIAPNAGAMLAVLASERISVSGGKDNAIAPNMGAMLTVLASDSIKVSGNSQYFAALSSSRLDFAGFTPLTNNPNSLVAINTRFLNGATSGSPVAGNLANITVIGGQSHSIYNTLPRFIENSVLLGGNNLLPVDNAAVVRNLVIQGGALMLGNPNDSAYAAPSLGSLLVSGSATQLNTPTGLKAAATIGWRKGANDTALFYRNDDLMFGALPTEAGGTGNTSGEAKPIGDAGGDLTGYYPNPIIRDSAVSNAKMSNMPKWTIKGNAGANYYPPQDLSVDDTKELLVLDKVDNTPDLEKPISNDTQSALDSEAAARESADTALQTAMDGKVGKSGDTMSGELKTPKITGTNGKLEVGSSSADGSLWLKGNLSVTDSEGAERIVVESDDYSWRGRVGTGAGIVITDVYGNVNKINGTASQLVQGDGGLRDIPEGVSQQANLSSTAAANSITAGTIGVTGTLPIANGGTGQSSSDLLSNGKQATVGNKTFRANDRVAWLEFNCGGTSAPADSPHIDFTEHDNGLAIMDNKIPGTPIVFVLNGGTPWTQTKGTAAGQPWPSPDPASDLPYIKHYNRYFGQVQNSWGWRNSEVSYDSVPDATRSVWAASATHVFIYLGIGTVAISGVDTRQPFFERMCL